MNADRVTWKERFNAALPITILAILTLPIVIGYIWIFISTFSRTTYGLEPQGNLTLDNWSFLWKDPKSGMSRSTPLFCLSGRRWAL